MSKAAVAIVSGSERLRSALSALRHRNYRLYWFGQLSSVLAQNMEITIKQNGTTKPEPVSARRRECLVRTATL